MRIDWGCRTTHHLMWLSMVVGLLLASARPAHAGLIPGMPSVVYDPVNYASAVARYRQLFQQGRGQIRQIEYAYEQAKHLRDQARGWSRFSLGDFAGVLTQAGRTMGAGVSLGYGNPELGALFRRQFPRVPHAADGMRIPHADQLNSLRDLAFAAVMSSQMQGAQIDVARQSLAALRRGVVSAGTERQLQQAQAAVQAFQAEQDLLTRHTLLSLNQQLAAANARDAQRQMEEEMRAARADGRWRAWEEAVVGLHGQNLADRDRTVDAIRRRAGIRGAAPHSRDARDPRDLSSWRDRGRGNWEFGGGPITAGGTGGAEGGMAGTESGEGPRGWDPASVEHGGGPVDPWNPEGGTIFGAANGAQGEQGQQGSVSSPGRPGGTAAGGGGATGGSRATGTEPASERAGHQQ